FSLSFCRFSSALTLFTQFSFSISFPISVPLLHDFQNPVTNLNRFVCFFLKTAVCHWFCNDQTGRCIISFCLDLFLIKFQKQLSFFHASSLPGMKSEIPSSKINRINSYMNQNSISCFCAKSQSMFRIHNNLNLCICRGVNRSLFWYNRNSIAENFPDKGLVVDFLNSDQIAFRKCTDFFRKCCCFFLSLFPGFDCFYCFFLFYCRYRYCLYSALFIKSDSDQECKEEACRKRNHMSNDIIDISIVCRVCKCDSRYYCGSKSKCRKICEINNCTSNCSADTSADQWITIS